MKKLCVLLVILSLCPKLFAMNPNTNDQSIHRDPTPDSDTIVIPISLEEIKGPESNIANNNVFNSKDSHQNLERQIQEVKNMLAATQKMLKYGKIYGAISIVGSISSTLALALYLISLRP